MADTNGHRHPPLEVRCTIGVRCDGAPIPAEVVVESLLHSVASLIGAQVATVPGPAGILAGSATVVSVRMRDDTTATAGVAALDGETPTVPPELVERVRVSLLAAAPALAPSFADRLARAVVDALG